jgi:IstB-like ATP binding protein
VADLSLNPEVDRIRRGVVLISLICRGATAGLGAGDDFLVDSVVRERVGVAADVQLVGLAAMIDRLVHHAEVIALKGDSYRLKDRDLGRVPPTANTED